MTDVPLGDRERVARVLGEHDYDYPDSMCACGHLMAKPWLEWRLHAADAVLAALDPAGWVRDALYAAADTWESAAESDVALRNMAERHYRAGGPSMPAIFLRLRADALHPNAQAAASDSPDAIKARIAAALPAERTGRG